MKEDIFLKIFFNFNFSFSRYIYENEYLMLEEVC